MYALTTGKKTPRLFLAALALLGAFLFAPPVANAQDVNFADIRARLETIRAVFDYVESGISTTSRRAELQRLRNAIEPLRDELQQRISDLEPRLAEIENRVKAMGPAPAADKPEEPGIASERKKQTQLQSEIDSLIKQARVLVLRGDQIASRIDELRRARLADRLFERTTSLLDPKLWLGVIEAIPTEAKLIAKTASDWFAVVKGLPGFTQSIAIALAASAAAIFGIFFSQGWIRRRLSSVAAAQDGDKPLPRLRRAKAAVRDAILGAAALPLAGYAVIEIFSSFDFIVGDGHAALLGILAAATLYAVGRALADALLRPADAPRRIFAISDEAAARLYSFTTYTLLIAAVGASLNVIHRSLGAPRILVAATSVLMAGLIAANIIYALMKTRGDSMSAKGEVAPNWLRLVLWIASIVILGAAILGYVWLASFLTSRLIHAAIVIAAAYTLLTLINAYFGEGMHASSERGRALASTLGIRSSSLDLAAVLLAGAARVFIVVVALFLVLGNWGTSLTDLITSFDRASFGIELGKLRISLYDIFSAVVILVIGILLSRVLQRWLNDAVLPRTRLDTSLKNSIATIAGYAGVIAAISFALARLGLNLENIALVAGALSVGIGFGLQAIVSNFVSGLILLTERPVKVGDLINVKGQDGYIRRISVRSTEVETFDRATLIIPNTELVTGAVTNWTHHNTLSRIKIPVSVPATVHVDRVRDMLLKIANDHPHVVKQPEPKVMLLNIDGDNLGFELRCLIDNVTVATQTKSDLNFEILRAFRKARIRKAEAQPVSPDDREDEVPDSNAPKLASNRLPDDAESKR